MKRNREKTAERFIDAVHEILKDEGYEALGVNAVAERAGANKVLLYRYFGSFEGLMEEYVQRMDPFPILIEKIEAQLEGRENLPVEEVCSIIFASLEQSIFENPSFAEMLRWEIAASNPLTRRIAESREENGVRLTRYLKGRFEWDRTKDVEAVLAILTGGLFYLWLRSGSVESYNNVPISDDSGRKRLLEAATVIVKTIFS